MCNCQGLRAITVCILNLKIKAIHEQISHPARTARASAKGLHEQEIRSSWHVVKLPGTNIFIPWSKIHPSEIKLETLAQFESNSRQHAAIPPNGWFTLENPIKMNDSEVPLFMETPLPKIPQAFTTTTTINLQPGFRQQPRRWSSWTMATAKV